MLGLSELGDPGLLRLWCHPPGTVPSGSRSWKSPPSAIGKTRLGDPGIWLIIPHKCSRAYVMPDTALDTGHIGSIIDNQSLLEKEDSLGLVPQGV